MKTHTLDHGAPQRIVQAMPAPAPSRTREALRGMDSYAVQARSLAPEPESPAATQRAAAHGASGQGAALPHLAAIQASFGAHDVSGVAAHVGGRAAEACDAMGAAAYASGGDVAFAAAPDLHTAAHEAAHIVQQRAGVSLYGGV